MLELFSRFSGRTPVLWRYLLAATRARRLGSQIAGGRAMRRFWHTSDALSTGVGHTSLETVADLVLWPLFCATLALTFWLWLVAGEQAGHSVIMRGSLLQVFIVLYVGRGIHDTVAQIRTLSLKAIKCSGCAYPSPGFASSCARFVLRRSPVQSVPLPRGWTLAGCARSICCHCYPYCVGHRVRSGYRYNCYGCY